MTRIVITEKLEEQKNIFLTGEKAHYLLRVKRHKKGDFINIQDKNGLIFNCHIKEIDKENINIQVVEYVCKAKIALPVHVITCVPKAKLLDDSIRKMSEIGVSKITLTNCKRSVVIPGEQKISRWRKIASDSIKQCQRCLPMEIVGPLSFTEALNTAKESTCLIMDPRANASALNLIRNEKLISVCIAIGPEGGFTDEEIQQAKDAEFKPTRMGELILRVETALIVGSTIAAMCVGGMD